MSIISSTTISRCDFCGKVVELFDRPDMVDPHEKNRQMTTVIYQDEESGFASFDVCKQCEREIGLSGAIERVQQFGQRRS